MEILNLIQQLRGQTEYVVNGSCTPEFEPLMQALRQVIPLNRKGGVALAVYFRGELVADLWMGLQQGATLWQEDTLSLSYSTGKGVLATLVHILVDKGYLDYDRPVREYWPEFGILGKENITLRHLLSHSSGLYDIRHVIHSAEMMLDWDAMLKAYEQAIPRFEPNSASAYQALSFGWLVGGVIEKVMQEPLAVTFERELVEPLGLTGEAYFGTPDTELERVARPYRKPPATHSNPPENSKPRSKAPPTLTATQSILKFFGQDPLDVRDALVPKKMGQFDLFSDDALQACMPAFNGVFSARALAKIYAVLAAGGEFEGKSYLSQKTMSQLATIQHRRRDRVMPISMSWRLGYHRVITMGKRVPNGFGHMGYNGSGAWCDPDRELSIAFVTSYSMDSMGGDPRFWWLSQRTLQLADKVINGRRGWL
ncbi:serine hydrolase domain-containing protein [Aquirhabdus parva]|nr:serine hydrolase domain-containing protein [Aquirhabdus parva]